MGHGHAQSELESQDLEIEYIDYLQRVPSCIRKQAIWDPLPKADGLLEASRLPQWLAHKLQSRTWPHWTPQTARQGLLVAGAEIGVKLIKHAPCDNPSVYQLRYWDGISTMGLFFCLFCFVPLFMSGKKQSDGAALGLWRMCTSCTTPRRGFARSGRGSGK